MEGLELIRSSAVDGARQIALERIRRVAEAGLRLHDPEDLEALHDFRVALRRLRTFLRAYAPVLPFGKKPLRRLQRLARSTNGPRDAEVGLDWLRRLRPELRSNHRVGYRWLESRLQKEKLTAYAAVRRRVPLRWMRLEVQLRSRLDLPPVPPSGGESLGQFGARRIESARAVVIERLARIDSVENEEAVHATRIRAKRLRYLLEPFKNAVPEVRQALDTLKKFQDLFGDLNDAYVMLHRLRREAAIAGAERAERLLSLAATDDCEEATLRGERRRDELSGLLQIAGRARRRRRELFDEIDSRFLGDGGKPLSDQVRTATERLAALARPALKIVRDRPPAEDQGRG